MNTSLEACRLKHKYRGHNNYCTLCGDSIKWIKNKLEDYWVPVDAKPIMYQAHTDGRYTVYDRYHRKVPFALVFSLKGKQPTEKIFQGLIPHYYTCEVLKSKRAAYVKAQMERQKHDS